MASGSSMQAMARKPLGNAPGTPAPSHLSRRSRAVVLQCGHEIVRCTRQLSARRRRNVPTSPRARDLSSVGLCKRPESYRRRRASRQAVLEIVFRDDALSSRPSGLGMHPSVPTPLDIMRPSYRRRLVPINANNARPTAAGSSAAADCGNVARGEECQKVATR